jgi:ATP-dependent RNA helicase RhlB
MNLPEKVSATPEKMTAERVEQVLYHVASKEKFPLLLGLLRKEGMARTMIFVNTKREAEFLCDRLTANDFPSRVISGDVDQKKRLRILDDFKNGKLPILIATDVASRGLHIDGVSHVINYDLPQDCEDYVHRIGRTARAGAEGKAISLADEDGAFHLEAIEEYSKQKIPVEWADSDLYVKDYKRTKPKPRSSPGSGASKGTSGRGRPGGEKSKPQGRRNPPGRPKPQGDEKTAAAPELSDVAKPETAGVVEKKQRRRPRRKKPAGGGDAPV